METTKEFTITERGMFACQAYDVLGLSRFVRIDDKNPFPPDEEEARKYILRLRGSETEGLVGMAHVTILPAGNVRVHIVMDHALPERLQVEIGELGIEVYYTFDVRKDDVGVGRQYDKFSRIYLSNIVPTRVELRNIGGNTKVDGDHPIRRLKPTEWSWEF